MPVIEARSVERRGGAITGTTQAVCHRHKVAARPGTREPPPTRACTRCDEVQGMHDGSGTALRASGLHRENDPAMRCASDQAAAVTPTSETA